MKKISILFVCLLFSMTIFSIARNAEAAKPVQNQRPTAVITGPSSGEVDEQLTFDAYSSFDTDGTIVSYEWDFGDGTTDTGVLVTHTYTSIGDYPVQLTVTDDGGKTGNDSLLVSISGLACAPVDGRIEVSMTGSCNSIQAAIDAAPGTAAEPVVIDVLPGNYVEDIEFNSNYIHIQGSGRDVTFIRATSTSNFAIWLNSTGISHRQANVTISGFTIEDSNTGIYCSICSSRITDNVIRNNVVGIYSYGGRPIIENNIITGNTNVGVNNTQSAQPIIRNNIISSNDRGILDFNSSASSIENNIIRDNVQLGLFLSGGRSDVRYNRITGNGTGVSSSVDIYAVNGQPNISFNEYDTISGTSGIGLYNVNISGGAAPAP